MMRRLLLTSGLVMGLSLVAVPKASADTFNLNDIYCNCLPAGSTAGGTVAVTQVNSTTVQFVVTLGALLDFHYTNAFDLFAFNYSGTNPTLTASGLPQNVGGDSTADWVVSSTSTGSGSMDGAGHSYEYFVNCATCTATGGDSGVNSITFTVSNAGGLTLANFEFTNGNSNDFAAAVTQIGKSGCTGVIGGGNGTGQSAAQASSGTAGTANCGSVTVPDGGATAGLLGLGMLGLGYLRRRLA